MPILWHRRSFLKQAAATLVVLPRVLSAANNSEFRIALLSDTHIAANSDDTFRGFHPHQNLRIVLEQVEKQPHDLVLVNGDLARKSGLPDDYRSFMGYLSPVARQKPLAITLGNHDDRRNVIAAVQDRAGSAAAVDQKLVTTLDAGPINLILLDSLLATDIAAGQLGRKQRTWLQTYLAGRGAKPAVVIVHHNPDPDEDTALVDASELLRIVGGARSVKALIFGHTHVYRHTVSDGLHLINLPAVGYNFADGVPVGWVDASFTGTGAHFTLHAIAGETRDDGKTMELSWRN